MNRDKQVYQNLIASLAIVAWALLAVTFSKAIYHNPYINIVIVIPAVMIAKNKDLNTTMSFLMILLFTGAFVSKLNIGSASLQDYSFDFESPLFWAIPNILTIMFSYYFVNFVRLKQLRKGKENDLRTMIYNSLFCVITCSVITIILFVITSTHFKY